jgi:hypothetical protein
MKPTPQVSSEQSDRISFPLTDYQYQSTDETLSGRVRENRAAEPLRSIWKLSAEFFGAEAMQDFAIEFTLFTLIAGLSFWPIISMLVAVARMIRNY